MDHLLLETSFIFTINGKTDTIIGSQDETPEGSVIRHTYFTNNSSYYVLKATKYISHPDKFFEFYLLLETPNVKEGTYTYSDPPTVTATSGQSYSSEIDSPDFGSYHDYGSFNSSYQTIIVITKIHDYYADGTYSDRIGDYS